MEDPRPRISVIIPTHNRREILPRVLGPLRRDVAIQEIIVVVDGSDDGSIEWLQKESRSDPKLVSILHEKSCGAQVSRADGLAASRSQFALFLDDDVVAHPSLASKHLEIHLRHQGLVVVGYLPVLLPPRRRRGEFATYLYAEEYEGRCSAYERDRTEILRTLWWGNVSMRRSDVLQVGLVEPGLESIYHEDQDFGLRCLEAGLTGVFDRSLRADHLHERDLGGFLRDARSQGVGTVLVHTRHLEMTGPLQLGAFESGLASPLSWTVRASRHRLVETFISKFLVAVIKMAGMFNSFRVETDAARLLRRIAQHSSAAKAMKLLGADNADARKRLIEISRRQ